MDEKICLQDGIITNLEQIKNQFIAITVLQETTTKLFLTWPTSKFGNEFITYIIYFII